MSVLEWNRYQKVYSKNNNDAYRKYHEDEQIIINYLDKNGINQFSSHIHVLVEYDL